MMMANKFVVYFTRNWYLFEFEVKGFDLLFQQQVERRTSLTPPERPDVSWDNYASADAGRAPCLSRHLIAKENAKAFKATVAMVRI